MPVKSPCIGVCQLDDDTMTYCIGCYRDRAGIARWTKADDAEKQSIVDAAEARSKQIGDNEDERNTE